MREPDSERRRSRGPHLFDPRSPPRGQVLARRQEPQMQARIERPPTTFDVHVYLFDHSAEGTIVYNLDGTEREVVSSGAVPEPSFQCDEQILRALVAAGSAPSSAMSRHL